jgi:type IV pilus assembly protein PilQ
VQVENGGTVVLGGIFIEEQSQLLSQVPGLGEVPLLGALFRSRQTQHQRRELLVFITPRIISSAESGLP